ncbi:MAG: 3-methyl-2-oxobutanoate dehydrogenase subunit beta, partial [Planctomycetes bacterium]|nr:3-methyl-2-oxobutanoate dehydrogenase subunit beta [Planctomycetota bacterium]
MENNSQFLAGNIVVAESAIRAGCQFYAGYPITPQNDLGAYMAAEMPKHGRIFIQAESELAAINMVFGASAAGARAMTTSSSPGISLKQEGISYLCGAELPGVIVNVMRGGPGLGNISGSQSDYFQATRGGGHGDYRMLVLAPNSAQEIADLTATAFALSERYRMPAMILYDGYLGQLIENVTLPSCQETPALDRPYALSGNAGRKSRVIRSLYMGDGALEEHNQRLQARYKEVARREVRSEQT